MAGVALLLALGQAPALAATINVGGGCLLVDAITAANTDNAIGLCKAGSGADTLVLRAGSTHTLTTVNNSTPYGPTGLPVITSAITIFGNGSTIARASGAPAFRIVAVGGTGNLTLRATTISGGLASENTFPGNTGGGAFVQGGALTLANSTLSGNTARYGGGVLTYHDATVTLTSSTVSGNTATSSGGGMYNTNISTLTLTSSTISGNSADSFGGGVSNKLGRATLTNSTVSGNTASFGAGLSNSYGVMTLINSTVSRNTGIVGGGVHSGGREGNLRSDVVLIRTLISGNIAEGGAEVYQRSGGVVTANNFNLFGHSTVTNKQAFFGFTPGAFDSTATSDSTIPTALTSILNPSLANNGGLTRTHALVANSPALDNTRGCPPPATDQRGVPRPQIGIGKFAPQCDIGAFELVPPGTVTCDGIPATKVGTSAGETLTGTNGVDVIQGLGGNDVIRGLAGNDVVCGGTGNDRLFGGANDDRLFGEAGTDRLDGELDFDRCDGGPPTKGDTAANCEQVSGVP